MAMVLRDAFRYCNYLDKILREVERYLMVPGNVIETIEEHKRSAAQAEAKDEIVSNKPFREISIGVDTIISFACDVFNEKAALCKKISDAKNQHCPDMDIDIGLNKKRQDLINAFQSMVGIKEKTVTVPHGGSAYCFNAEGNQTVYYYDIVKTQIRDFDAKKLKGKINELADTASHMSTTIDYWRSSIPVEFEPRYNINNSFSELLEEYNEVKMSA